MKVTAVVGAQFGSEGKGNIVRAIADEYETHVRTGGMLKHAIPLGWTNKDANLVIGRGAVLDVNWFEPEIDELLRLGIDLRGRLFIDKYCRLLPGNPALELAIHDRRLDGLLADTVAFLHRQSNVLLEGSQGAGLSQIHGTWPHVTSADTTAGQFMINAGLHPRMLTDCILVARTFPVHWAGTGGPLQGEISWNDISEKVGRPVEEAGSRVGQWNEDMFLRACQLNGPTQVALNFIDYLAPEDEGVEDYHKLSKTSHQFIEYVERLADCPVTMVGTGGKTCHVIRR